MDPTAKTNGTDERKSEKLQDTPEGSYYYDDSHGYTTYAADEDDIDASNSTKKPDRDSRPGIDSPKRDKSKK